jgi:hypothetical protein
MVARHLDSTAVPCFRKQKIVRERLIRRVLACFRYSNLISNFSGDDCLSIRHERGVHGEFPFQLPHVLTPFSVRVSMRKLFTTELVTTSCSHAHVASFPTVAGKILNQC